MIFFTTYLIAGLLAYLWLARKTKDGFESATGMLLFGEIPGLILTIALWPIMIPLFLHEGRILDREKRARENKIPDTQDALSALTGMLGDTLTHHNPSGKIVVEGREYESRSVLAYIPKGQRIKVLGYSMNHLEIEPTEPDASGQRR